MTLDFGLIKLSVLLLYRRLFLGRIFGFYSLAMCILIVLWSFAFFFATAFQCGTRISAWWTSVKTIDQYCDKTAVLELGFGISDVITDLMVLMIPLPIIWKLHMSNSNKAALSGIFLLGFLYVKWTTQQSPIIHLPGILQINRCWCDEIGNCHY